MDNVLTTELLDNILAIQLTVSWAGESICEPPRLGWWKTDLVDPAGGGDLMDRLLPITHQWASLEAVREAAIRADGKARGQMPDPDKVRTLFFLGFDLDERLSERLAHHKRFGVEPGDALPLGVDFSGDFLRDMFADALLGVVAEAKHTVVPGGRQVKGDVPDNPDLLVQKLASALLPLVDEYPMPFFRLK